MTSIRIWGAQLFQKNLRPKPPEFGHPRTEQTKSEITSENFSLPVSEMERNKPKMTHGAAHTNLEVHIISERDNSRHVLQKQQAGHSMPMHKHSPQKHQYQRFNTPLEPSRGCSKESIFRSNHSH